MNTDDSAEPMLRADEIPDWVPTPVKSLALVEALPVRPQLRKRLASDERMKSVWKALMSKDVNADAVASIDSLYRLGTWGVSDFNLTEQDRACVAVFAFTAIEFNQQRVAWTQKDINFWRKKFADAAVLCSWISNDPMFQSETDFVEAASITARGLEKHAKLLEERGIIVDFADERSPYRFAKSSGNRNDDEARGKVRKLAMMVRAIYGSYLYEHLANLAQSALGSRAPHQKTVEKWCADLPLG
jgi:hypothetical protein